eukprot:jgi/Astpho2/9667/Aster-03930
MGDAWGAKAQLQGSAAEVPGLGEPPTGQQHTLGHRPASSAGKEVAGQGSENAVAFPHSLGGGDSEPDEGTCAICLDRTPVEEVALVKGCEHSYCAKCILKWAVQRDNCRCPQCKAPFQYLFTYRNLDGTLNDFPQEESVVLLKRAEWFVATLKDSEKGKEVETSEPTHDYDRYYAEYDDDEEVEDYYFSAAAGRARIVVGNRRWGESGYVASGRMQARPGGKDKKPGPSPSAAAAGSSNAARRGKKGKGKAPNAAPTGAQESPGPAGGAQLAAASAAQGSSSVQPAAVAAHTAAKGKAPADAVPGGDITSAEGPSPALAQASRGARGKAPASPGQSTSSSTAAPATPEQAPAKEASSGLASQAASGGLSAALAAASGSGPASQAPQLAKTPGRVFGYKSNNVEHACNSPGPDPPQLYGSSWEHGSWGRNKAKRGQVDGSPLGSSPGSDGGKGIAGRRARRAAKRAAADARGATYDF